MTQAQECAHRFATTREQWTNAHINACSVDGCNSPRAVKGFCNTHYNRMKRHGDPLATKMPGRGLPPHERILLRVDARGICWEYTGSLNSAGYGRVTVRGDGMVRTLAVHRVVWEGLVGPIPEGYELDHLCRVRHCVNPDHLEPVPPRVNVMRSYSASAMNARKVACINGHEFTPENTGRSSRGTRLCLTCKRKYDREYKRLARRGGAA